MITIKFKRPQAAGAFISMAEGMWENERDDAGLLGSEKLSQLTELLDVLGKPTPDFEHAWQLPDHLRDIAKDVADNCADNAHDMGLDDESDLDENPEDAEMACCPWEVTIEEVTP